MTTLNFIYPEQSGILFSTFIFPDGQPHLKLDMASINNADKKQTVRIIARIACSNDLFTVLLAKNTLDYEEFERVELAVTYLMAARMDRVMQPGEPFSLKVVCDMLNRAAFRKIFVFDPHSEVTTALLDRSYAITNHHFVKDAIDDYFSKNTIGDFCLVSPDAGALKKIHHLARFAGCTEVVECFKERDLKTGALSGFKTANTGLNGKTCFIVDDLCDGGGTFAGTAALLKSLGSGPVVLVVSHGIFSKGVNIEGIDTIYCTDSFRHAGGVNCFEVLRYM